MRFLVFFIEALFVLPLMSGKENPANCWLEVPVLLSDCSANKETQHDFLILIHETPKCGYCHFLMRDFQNAQLPQNAKIIFVTTDVKEEDVLKREAKYRCMEVRFTTETVSPCGSKIFPMVNVYRLKNGNWKKTKTYTGYRKNLWVSLNKLCSR
jgi:thioredoxin-related protein